jgi:HEAT repeat protein
MRHKLRQLCRTWWVSNYGRAALLVLLLCGPGASSGEISKWTKALREGDEKSRILAIDALGQAGPEAKGAVGAMAQLLGDRSAKVRAHAAHALQGIGPPAAAAASALVKAAGDPDAHVRREAVMALYYTRSDRKLLIPVLSKALEDSDPAVRVAALDALTSIGDAAVPTLSKALEKPALRYWAALALGELGDKAKPAVAALTAALKDDQPVTRREVLVALARIGPDAAASVPAIIPLLSDKDKTVAHAAAFALGRMGPAAAGAADALRKGQEGSEEELMRTVSTWALAHVEPDNKELRADAIKRLISALQAENPRVQSAALKGLIELEPDPAKLVPILSGVLCQGETQLVDEAFAAVAAMGDAATPALIEALKSPEACLRATALLAQLGPKAGVAAPALAAALGDPNPEVRREALFALASMGPEAAPALAAITQALDDPEMRVRAIAAYALGRIGEGAHGAIPKLRTELQSSDPVVRVAAAWALVHVSPDASQVASDVLPVLTQGLKNNVVAVRRGSAEALGHLGKGARAAEGALKVAARDEDETVRKAALAALEQLGAVQDSPVRPQSVPIRKR